MDSAIFLNVKNVKSGKFELEEKYNNLFKIANV